MRSAVLFRLPTLMVLLGVAMAALGASPAAAARASKPFVPSGYEYVSPRAGARFVTPWTQIALRQGRDIRPSSLAAARPVVAGTSSGLHDGEWLLSTDRKTVIFKPYMPFHLGERVSVNLAQGVRTDDGESLPPLDYTFEVSNLDPLKQPRVGLEELLPAVPQGIPEAEPRAPFVLDGCDTMPTGYPQIDLLLSDDPAPGYVFISPFTFASANDPGHLMVLDEFAEPIFYRQEPARSFDFKRQPNGLLTYMPVYQIFDDSWFAMDSSYAIVDSFRTVGYVTDLHGLQVLDNGHVLMQAYDPQTVGMDTVVAGGHPMARVTGYIIQEQDASKNVVFEWRSWDHFEITDVVSPMVSLTDSLVDYVHGNSVELDMDGHLIISSRHMNEITKIDHNTGDIIWRMGLNAANNDFTFINDTQGFSHQHDARRLANGNLLLYDNGNFLVPQVSRALEYDLDEVGMTATLVWSYQSPEATYGPFMGGAQRLDTGGTLICWGGTNPNPKVTEVHADDSKAFELGFENRHWSYRAFKFPWASNLIESVQEVLDFGHVPQGSTDTLPLHLHNPGTENFTVTCFGATNPGITTDATLPITIAPGAYAVLNVSFLATDAGPFRGKLYARSVQGGELIATDVLILAEGVGVIGVGDAPLDLRLYPTSPNPFRAVTTIRFDLPRSAPVALDIYDVRGRLIETLVNGTVDAGRHEVRWAPSRRPAGLYFVRMKSKGFEQTRKLALIR